METKSLNGRTCYQDHCPRCGKDRGFVPKARLGLKCRSCTNSFLKKGKSAHNKGMKTGKPAWNAKNIDPMHKILRDRVSRHLRHSLTTRGLSKNKVSTFEILGFDAQALMTHLESKFESGMTWENRGLWEIDHIIPDSWFNYTSMDDKAFKDCWALNNLQPMWKLENISKGARYAGSFQVEEK